MGNGGLRIENSNFQINKLNIGILILIFFVPGAFDCGKKTHKEPFEIHMGFVNIKFPNGGEEHIEITQNSIKVFASTYDPSIDSLVFSSAHRTDFGALLDRMTPGDTSYQHPGVKDGFCIYFYAIRNELEYKRAIWNVYREEVYSFIDSSNMLIPEKFRYMYDKTSLQKSEWKSLTQRHE